MEKVPANTSWAWSLSQEECRILNLDDDRNTIHRDQTPELIDLTMSAMQRVADLNPYEDFRGPKMSKILELKLSYTNLLDQMLRQMSFDAGEAGQNMAEEVVHYLRTINW